MTKVQKSWAYKKGNEPDRLKFLLSNLSIKTRREQYDLFWELLKPKKTDRVVDVGVSSVEELPDTNYFEKIYPNPEKLTAISIDDPLDFRKRYPLTKYKQIMQGKRLPFPSKSFDIVVSWATLEHVGDREKQRFFVSELFRIGKKVFLTTPYRGCLYEPHSGLLFVHWLPRNWFGIICRLLDKSFWGSSDNLRCLWKRELEELIPEKKGVKVIICKILGIIPSHLIVIKD